MKTLVATLILIAVFCITLTATSHSEAFSIGEVSILSNDR
jgi:hypothetical protein